MKISTRCRYGLRAILELAMEYGKGPLQIKIIAERQDISNKYLEQIMAILKSVGLVRSIRGAKGGYILAKEPKNIRISDVFVALEGPLVTVDCVDHPEFCTRCTDCVTRHVWTEIQDSIMNVMTAITLQDLVDKSQTGKDTLDYQI
jgi:Rrf2 family cysteine metabolism transcriptional repressor